MLGRVGTHIFFKLFFLEKKYQFMHFERHLAFQNAQDYIFFPEKPEKKILGCTSKFR